MEMKDNTDLRVSYAKAESFPENEASSSSSSVLPEEVLPLILSSTSACDVGRLALVNRSFAQAANSDLVWRKLLPPNYEWVAANALGGPICWESLKELYQRFCNHILVGDGLQGYGCDPKTGGLYLTFGARTLRIIWGSEPSYWRWPSGTEVQGSRFAEVAYLVSVCWLEIQGEIQTRLPPGTYSLRWVLQFARTDHNEVYGPLGKWKGAPVTFTLTSGEDVQSSEIEFPPPIRRAGERGDVHERVQWRDSRWFEYRAGIFTVDKGGLENMQDVHLKFDMREISDLWWKSGLFVDGVIIRRQLEP